MPGTRLIRHAVWLTLSRTGKGLHESSMSRRKAASCCTCLWAHRATVNLRHQCRPQRVCLCDPRDSGPGFCCQEHTRHALKPDDAMVTPQMELTGRQKLVQCQPGLARTSESVSISSIYHKPRGPAVSALPRDCEETGSGISHEEFPGRRIHILSDFFSASCTVSVTCQILNCHISHASLRAALSYTSYKRDR